MYAARTRNGFTPASRAELFKKLKPLEISECPFANLPEKKAGRWGAGLTAAKMAECRWLKPQLIGQFEFVEWPEDAHLRHSRFVALRDVGRPGENIDYYSGVARAFYLTDLERWRLSVAKAAELLARAGMKPYLFIPRAQRGRTQSIQLLGTGLGGQQVEVLGPGIHLSVDDANHATLTSFSSLTVSVEGLAVMIAVMPVRPRGGIGRRASRSAISRARATSGRRDRDRPEGRARSIVRSRRFAERASGRSDRGRRS